MSSSPLDDVLELIAQLTAEDRKCLGNWMDFQRWEDAFNDLKRELAERHAAMGHAPPTNDEVHIEIDARRTPEEWEALRRDLQIAEDQLERGEWLDADTVLADLTQRIWERHRENELAEAQGKITARQVFRIIKALPCETQWKLRKQLP